MMTDFLELWTLLKHLHNMIGISWLFLTLHPQVRSPTRPPTDSPFIDPLFLSSLLDCYW
jgi:hypothetical protein